jgi:hypothetical protein
VVLKTRDAIATLSMLSCLTVPPLAFGQGASTTGNSSQSEKGQQQDSKGKTRNKKDKKSKKGDNSRRPMDERAPIPTQPGRMDNPTLPQRTPGQQPTPGSPDPTSPTTTRPR